MQKLHFSTTINAPVQKVWDTMIQDESYRQWVSAMGAEGYFKGSWEKGSKIIFTGPGEEGGMVSRIAENRPYEFISIEHVGILKNGVEDTTSDEAKKWTPAFENYRFTEKDGVTTVNIELDSLEENTEMFNEMWPLGLQKIKELAESK